MKNDGPAFSASGPLGEKYPDLAGSRQVRRAVKKAVAAGTKVPATTDGRIGAYLSRVKGVLDVGQDRAWDLYSSKLVRESVLDISDSEVVDKVSHDLFESEKRIAVERGRGAEVKDIEAQAEEAGILARYGALVAEKRETQEKTLRAWLDYLRQNDAGHSDWFRYLTVRSVAKMGVFDGEKGEFRKRTPHTVAAFPEIDSEALGFCFRMLETGPAAGDFAKPEEADDRKTLETLARKKDFAGLYGFARTKLKSAANVQSLDGRWVTYPQGSDPVVLENALRGKGTGWCTAEGSAKQHLEGGDFHVFFTLADGTYSQPRAAIRMEKGEVAEVRGIGARQELEPALVETARVKFQPLPGGSRYEKTAADMARVTELARKTEAGEEFSKEDLRFLYEMEGIIEGFGYEKDPRIGEILGGRDARGDLAFVLDMAPEHISSTPEEALSGNIVFHFGILDLSGLKSAKGLKFPDSIGGGLELSGLTSAEGLKLPDSIGGYLNLPDLTSAEGLKLPGSMDGDLVLSGLKSAKGLKLPGSIGGDLDLSCLKSAEGLKLPGSIGGGLYLRGLRSAEGLKLPDSIGGNLELSGLKSAKGLALPAFVNGNLDLSGLPPAERKKLRSERPDLNIFPNP